MEIKIEELEMMEYYYNQIKGEIYNLRDYGGFTVKYISVSMNFYRKMIEKTKENQKYYVSFSNYPNKFLGYDIVINPIQEIDYIVLVHPEEEYKEDLWYIRNK